MNNLKIKGRFKVYNHLVVGEDKNIYQLSYFIGKRTMLFRKLKYYKDRNAYGYNGSYISKNRLMNLYYNSNEIADKLESKNIIFCL